MLQGCGTRAALPSDQQAEVCVNSLLHGRSQHLGRKGVLGAPGQRAVVAVYCILQPPLRGLHDIRVLKASCDRLALHAWRKACCLQRALQTPGGPLHAQLTVKAKCNQSQPPCYFHRPQDAPTRMSDGSLAFHGDVALSDMSECIWAHASLTLHRPEEREELHATGSKVPR